MPIPTSCPRCGNTYLLADRQAGFRVRCPECGEPFIVPAADRIDAPPAPRFAPQATLPAARVVKRPTLQSPMLFGVLVFCVVFLAGIGTLTLGLLLFNRNAPPSAAPATRNQGGPKAAAEPPVVRLPAPASDVVVGGGGRYLVLLLPSVRQVVLFDVSEAKLIKQLPVADADVKIAAGLDKLLIVQPWDKSVLRYNLETFEREASATVRLEVPPIAAAMGSASNGPLVISGVDYPRLGETVFFDLTRMQRIDVPLDPHNIFETSPRVFLRASADGRIFACQGDDGLPTQTCSWRKGRVTLNNGGRGGFPVPGPDGQVVYTDDGRYTPQLKPLGREGIYSWPAVHGSYYLSLPGDKKGRLDIYLAGVGKPLISLDDVDLGRALPRGPDPLPVDKRIHLIPDAKLLVVIPPRGDQLVLRRLDLEEALSKARFPFVAITSRPPTAARKGTTLRYQLQAKTDRGDPEYRLEEGPPGMTFGPQGLLTWPVPADFAESEADVLIHVKSPSGAETTQSFRIGVAE
jgi:hypothetical protein